MRKNLDSGRFCIIFVARGRILKVHRRVCVICSKDPRRTRDTLATGSRQNCDKFVECLCLAGCDMSDGIFDV